jgi:protocatechuate 3,4-dioxygenase beta subunit
MSRIALILACVLAAPLDSGLRIGEESPAFDPQHAWGPDKGSHACPMCKYGRIQGVLYWVAADPASDEVRTMATFLERESARRGGKRFKAYLIYTNPGRAPLPEVDSKLASLGRELGLRHVAVTYVPSPTDRETAALNRINPGTRNTIIVYRQRRVMDKFVNFEPTDENLERLSAAVNRAAPDGLTK